MLTLIFLCVATPLPIKSNITEKYPNGCYNVEHGGDKFDLVIASNGTFSSSNLPYNGTWNYNKEILRLRYSDGQEWDLDFNKKVATCITTQIKGPNDVEPKFLEEHIFKFEKVK